MCVILIGKADKVAGYIPAAIDANPDGNGLAWVENKNGESHIRYVKGISDTEVLKMANDFNPDVDIVFHARISTAGSVSPELCHPFPIENVPSVKTEGIANRVLFHNGHIYRWEKYAPDFLLKANKERWSDTRAIAHALANGRIKYKDLGQSINGVFAVLSTKPFKDKKNCGTVRRFGAWRLIKGAVWASNTNFLWTAPKTTTVYNPSYRYSSGSGSQGHFGSYYDKWDSELIPERRFVTRFGSAITKCDWRKQLAEAKKEIAENEKVLDIDLAKADDVKMTKHWWEDPEEEEKWLRELYGA
jgi:hypothetical protein